MERREFSRSAGILSASFAFPTLLESSGTTINDWRTFELTTRVEVLQSSGSTKVWLPAALIRETRYQKTITNSFHADGGQARLVAG